MKTRNGHLAGWLGLATFLSNTAFAGTFFVNVSNTTPVSPFNSWANAATNIQDAIDASADGDLILVTNGVYATGGRVVYGALTNRVVVDKAVTVQSVNGPGVTLIQGAKLSVTGGKGSVTNYPARCVYMTNNAALSGFTITNGGTGGSGDTYEEQSGGGVWCESSSATVSNCIIVHCGAYSSGGGTVSGTLINCSISQCGALSSGGGAAFGTLISCTLTSNAMGILTTSKGGGAFGGVLTNCIIAGNSAGYGGGAASNTLVNCMVSGNMATASLFGAGGGTFASVLTNCTLSGNSATNGGGAIYGTLVGCTLTNNVASGSAGGAYSNTLICCRLVNNQAGGNGGAGNCVLNDCVIVGNQGTGLGAGGGVWGGTLNNCIVYYNSATPFANYYGSTFNYCCTTPMPPGVGNITNAPLFVNLAGGDLHLQPNSPCINSGNNAYVSETTDLDGNPRIVGGTVDIGAYEYQTPTSVISYAWLQQYGLPTDGSVDYADFDGTPFNVYQDWIAGLNPTNPASLLVMTSAASTNQANGITVSWQSVNTRTYYLLRGSDLSAQPPFTAIQSNIVGQAGTTSYLDTSATNAGPYFYRVGVQ